MDRPCPQFCLRITVHVSLHFHMHLNIVKVGMLKEHKMVCEKLHFMCLYVSVCVPSLCLWSSLFLSFLCVSVFFSVSFCLSFCLFFLFLFFYMLLWCDQKMWLERTNLTTLYPLPGNVGWYPVVSTKTVSSKHTSTTKNGLLLFALLHEWLTNFTETPQLRENYIYTQNERDWN